MAPSRLVSTRTVAVVGAVVGCVGGGMLGWSIAYVGLVDRGVSDLTTVAFLVTLLTFPFGLMAPLAWFFWARSKVESPLWSFVLTVVGNVVLVTFAVVLAAAGVFEALGIDTATEAIALFVTLGFATFGALGLSRLFVRVQADETSVGDVDHPWTDAKNGDSE